MRDAAFLQALLEVARKLRAVVGEHVAWGGRQEVVQRIQRAGGLAAGGVTAAKVTAKRVCGSMKVNRLLGTPELAQCKQR